MLTTLQARFKKMLDMQAEVYEGTVRLDKIPEEERTYNQEIEAGRLSRKEAEIVLEADTALAVLRDDGTAVAFPEALEQARDDRRQIVRRLDRAEVGPLTQTIEEDVISALKEMIEALEQAKQDQEAEQRRPMPAMPSYRNRFHRWANRFREGSPSASSPSTTCPHPPLRAARTGTSSMPRTRGGTARARPGLPMPCEGGRPRGRWESMARPRARRVGQARGDQRGPQDDRNQPRRGREQGLPRAGVPGSPFAR